MEIKHGSTENEAYRLVAAFLMCYPVKNWHKVRQIRWAWTCNFFSFFFFFFFFFFFAWIHSDCRSIIHELKRNRVSRCYVSGLGLVGSWACETFFLRRLEKGIAGINVREFKESWKVCRLNGEVSTVVDREEKNWKSYSNCITKIVKLIKIEKQWILWSDYFRVLVSSL